MTESTDSVKFKLKGPDGSEVEYDMKYSIWIEDQNDMQRLKTPTGEPNISELWICRIQKATGIDVSSIRKMKAWEMSNLIQKWLMMNDVDPANFLEELKKDLKAISSLSTLSSVSSTSPSQN